MIRVWEHMDTPLPTGDSRELMPAGDSPELNGRVGTRHRVMKSGLECQRAGWNVKELRSALPSSTGWE